LYKKNTNSATQCRGLKMQHLRFLFCLPPCTPSRGKWARSDWRRDADWLQQESGVKQTWAHLSCKPICGLCQKSMLSFLTCATRKAVSGHVSCVFSFFFLFFHVCQCNVTDCSYGLGLFRSSKVFSSVLTQIPSCRKKARLIMRNVKLLNTMMMD